MLIKWKKTLAGGSSAVHEANHEHKLAKLKNPFGPQSFRVLEGPIFGNINSFFFQLVKIETIINKVMFPSPYITFNATF